MLEINFERLNEISGGEKSIEIQLLHLFAKTIDRSIVSMAETVGVGESEEVFKKWHDAIHELKGASQNIGFEDIGNFCKKIETKLPSDDEKKSHIEYFKTLKNQIEEKSKEIS
jgi:HPt (histidine-containing phosphotransfer) domain-containing protein